MEHLSFEESLSRIEEIVRLLSDERITLQNAVDLFKEAAGLISFCRDAVKSAELTVEEYKKDMQPGVSE